MNILDEALRLRSATKAELAAIAADPEVSEMIAKFRVTIAQHKILFATGMRNDKPAN